MQPATQTQPAPVAPATAKTAKPQLSWWDRTQLDLYRAKNVRLANDTHPELVQYVKELAATAGVPAPQLIIVDADRPNAFALNRNTIGITSMLLDVIPDKEMQRTVLAHEMGHIKHSLKHNMLRFWGPVAGSVAVATALMSKLFPATLQNSKWNFPIGASITAAGTIGIPHATVPGTEFEADMEGARLSGNPEGLADSLLALQKWSREYHSQQNYILPKPVRQTIAKIRNTYPQTQTRVDRLMAMREQEQTAAQTEMVGR